MLKVYTWLCVDLEKILIACMQLQLNADSNFRAGCWFYLLSLSVAADLKVTQAGNCDDK